MIYLSSLDSPSFQKESPFKVAIDPKRIPEHIAIVMDGNRRWARHKGLPAIAGHARGADMLFAIVKAAKAIGVKILTVYAFSTENWHRSSIEIEALMYLFKKTLRDEREFMRTQGVRLSTIGCLERFPKDVLEEIDISKEATADGGSLDLVLALNYGGRDDIRRAAQRILEDYSAGRLPTRDITEAIFSNYLYTAQWKDPDLFIRTSGEKRLSNFLLWQLSYAEVYITDVLWPDFDEKELLLAIADFQKRDRRCGS